MSTFLLPCLIFIQLVVSTFIVFGFNSNVEAGTARFEEYPAQYVWQKPRYFYPNVVEVEVAKTAKTVARRGRAPASSVPSDDIQPAPANHEEWINNVWVEDSAGVMNQMKNSFAAWREREQYRQKWDIESTGYYDTPNRQYKHRWFSKMLLRYADKRLMGSIKNAQKGSALSKVRTMKTALKPNSTASISKNFKLKFSAKVLKGRAFMKLVNPWVKAETEFTLNGRVYSRFQKSFKNLGIDTRLEYRLRQNNYTASVTKPLGNNITAMVSTTQSVAKSRAANSVFQLQYYTSF